MAYNPVEKAWLVAPNEYGTMPLVTVHFLLQERKEWKTGQRSQNV